MQSAPALNEATRGPLITGRQLKTRLPSVCCSLNKSSRLYSEVGRVTWQHITYKNVKFLGNLALAFCQWSLSSPNNPWIHRAAEISARTAVTNFARKGGAIFNYKTSAVFIKSTRWHAVRKFSIHWLSARICELGLAHLLKSRCKQ